MIVVRRFQFCAGHRIARHESKCAHVHGHNYIALVAVRTLAGGLDALGRVIDFGVIKSEVGDWIDTHWDHAFLYSTNDPVFVLVVENSPAFGRIYCFESDEPTAENMALRLKAVAGELLEKYHLSIAWVRLWETENCYAETE